MLEVYRYIHVCFYNGSFMSFVFQTFDYEHSKYRLSWLAPALLHRMLKRVDATEEEVFKGATVYNAIFWLHRIAQEATADYMDSKALYIAEYDDIVKNNEEKGIQLTPLWYDYAAMTVGVGPSYKRSRKMDVDTFIGMEENQVLEWANKGLSQSVYSDVDVPDISRIEARYL